LEGRGEVLKKGREKEQWEVHRMVVENPPAASPHFLHRRVPRPRQIGQPRSAMAEENW
jgi:hypothetical protein